MLIDTKYFGRMEIKDEQVISFPGGIPAFEHIREFALIPLPGSDLYFCLQSTKEPDTAFLLVKPWDFFPEYDIVLPDEDLKELSIHSREQTNLYNILTLGGNTGEVTANLLAPIVINVKTCLGKQVILPGEAYGTKHTLFKKERA